MTGEPVRSASGTSINRSIQEVRIDKAKTLLLSTNIGIKEIAYEVGYGNVSFFIRLFKGALVSRLQPGSKLNLLHSSCLLRTENGILQIRDNPVTTLHSAFCFGNAKATIASLLPDNMAPCPPAATTTNWRLLFSDQ
ncbi:MAG: helix-turn-helix domain-containing protein [Ketobacter sp.]|nr:MAG: helix-turn-helix domain-containing protein [Ketobacter sp.]